MPENPVAVLAEASTPVEREAIANWLASGELEEAVDGNTLQVELDIDDITDRLAARTDDPLVVPVRVVWLPPERDGVRRTRFTDVALLNNPRSPNRLMQRWIVGHDPDRLRVLTGEPAKLSDLRRRYRRSGGADNTRSFARYIVRSAVVTLERSERSLIGDRYKIPRMVSEEILENPRFRAELDEIAARIAITKDEAYRRADTALQELVAVQSRVVSDLFTQAMSPIHKRAWTVHADESGLANLRKLNRRHPLVFLPSHRSYVDAFVLGDILARNDFPPNHLVGGANLSFWPMGPIARRSGTIFIRRSFGDDEIYKAVVEEYFGYLLSKRFNLEWYFEGGRTRTGKLRPPRYGLLNYLAEAVRSRRVDDAMLVPVAIAYERLNELGAIADEQLGGVKKREGLAWMVNYVRSQQNMAGHVYVRFGEPISARDRLGAHGAQLGMKDPDDATTRRAVQKVAFEVAVGINSAMPITANSLVTLALLGVRERALTLTEVRGVVEPVLRYIEQRDIPQGEVGVLRKEKGLVGVLDQLADAKVVTDYAGGTEPVYAIEPGQHLIAAFYRNSAIHWFVNRAIMELSVLATVEGGFTDPLRAGWDEAHHLRDLLKFEFFFPEREVFEQELTAEMLLVDPLWADRKPTPDEAVGYLVDSGFIMAHRALRSFFGAQLVVAERLAAREPDAVIDRKAFLEECVAVGKQMQLQARLHSPESVSSELFASALKLAENRKLLEPTETAAGGDELNSRRKDFAEELRRVSDRIDKAEALDELTRKAGSDGTR